MFVKIKLEDQGNSKAPHIFNIEDSASIYNLKTHLESVIDIPADQQEIQTLDRTLENFDELSKVVNREIGDDNINGAAISLYANNKFFCFLQFYNQNEGDKQNNFFCQPVNARKLPIDHVPQYCENIVDSDESWHSESSESESTDNSNSSNSSDSSVDARARKRRSLPKPNSPSKRSRLPEHIEKICEPTSTTTLPLNQPKPMQNVAAKEMPTANVAKPAAVAPAAEMAAPQIPVRSEDRQIENVTVVESAPTSIKEKIVNARHTRELGQDPKDVATAPYVAMKPEHRRYALVISNAIDEPHPDYAPLMEHFYELFESSQSCGHLNFSEYASITAYDDKLWVLCEDNDTCDWISTGVRTLNLYKCFSFIKYFALSKCSMVLPQVVERKELANIFHLLELQNRGLSTDKWCVLERSPLDPESQEFACKAVTSLCKNEQLILYVDRESKSFIQEHCSKLKYCFWKLTFEW